MVSKYFFNLSKWWFFPPFFINFPQKKTQTTSDFCQALPEGCELRYICCGISWLRVLPPDGQGRCRRRAAVAARIGGSELTQPGSKAVPGVVQRPKQGQQQEKIIYVVYIYIYFYMVKIGKAFFNEVEWLPIILFFIHIKLGQVENYVFGNKWQHVW